jgi:hypothetical protein
VRPREAHAALNVTSIEKRRGGDECPVGTGRRRRHGGEAEESKEGDTTPDLRLKHLNTTVATYVLRQMKYLKHAFETIAKTPENIWKLL